MELFRTLVRDEDGQDMIEYGVLAAFIAVVAIATIRAIGPLIANLFASIPPALQ